MHITNIRTGLITIPLRTAFKTSLRTIDHITSVVVAVDTDTGVSGIGEAHPTGPITGESLGSVRGAISEFILPRLKGKEIANLEDTLNTLDGAMVKNTSAKAAVEMAIFDLFGKKYNIPVYRLLGGFRNQIETDLTISVNSPEEMAADSRIAVERGFRILKLKVGLNPELDIQRIKAVKEATGNDFVLRLDANQGWTAREAIKIMNEIEWEIPGIELVEQPVDAHDIDGLKWVKENINTPVLADEAVFSALDAENIINRRAADYLNIKLMKTGGLRGALRICALAETHRVECFLGCMMESKISVTAAAHLACARSIITRCDLDSPSLCASDPVRGGIEINGPWLKVTEAPGLGIEGVDGVIWD
ncbi:MAG TPA: dipeptide epimerase [Candidatus Rifleibacterium sp.]|nr:dipeptide epimerase [Candidatus Rifleibacterium sp.]HPT47095.1 dipeptide epimerase [Candidatus Rifleibacterium sp.]